MGKLCGKFQSQLVYCTYRPEACRGCYVCIHRRCLNETLYTTTILEVSLMATLLRNRILALRERFFGGRGNRIVSAIRRRRMLTGLIWKALPSLRYGPSNLPCMWLKLKQEKAATVDLRICLALRSTFAANWPANIYRRECFAAWPGS